MNEKDAVKGRGWGHLFAAKMIFLFMGYVIYYSLSRLLKVEDFGRYGLVTSIINVIDMFLITGTVQAVSKFVSEAPADTGKVQRGAISLQFLFGGGTFLALNLSAPFLTRILGDPSLAGLLRIASFVPLFYSFYCIFIGTLNGRKDFRLQGGFDIAFSFIKAGLVVGLTLLTGRLTYTFAGFALASFIILLLSLFIIGLEPGEPPFPVKKIFRFEFFIIFLTLFIYLTMNTDIYLLKALSGPGEGERYAAFYTAVYSLCRIPFQLSIPVTLIIFPYISESTSKGSSREARAYMERAFFFSSIFLVFLAVSISGCAGELITLLYPGVYLEGLPPLKVAPFGTVFFTLFYLSITIISGSGRPGTSTMISFFAIPLNFFLSGILIPRYGMMGAAWGTLIAMAAMFCLSSTFLAALLGFSFPLLNVIKILASGAASFLVLQLIPAKIPFLPLKVAAVTLVFTPLMVFDPSMKEVLARFIKRG